MLGPITWGKTYNVHVGIIILLIHYAFTVMALFDIKK